MGERIVDMGQYRGSLHGNRFPRDAGGGGISSGGGGMDDILKRLGRVEDGLADVKTEVAGIAGQLPHLATKSDVTEAKTSIIQWVVGTMIAAAGLAFAIAKAIH